MATFPEFIGVSRSRILLFILLCFTTFPLLAQNEPVRGFVSLQPFDIRVEALCSPAAYAEAWGLSGGELSGVEKDRALAKSLELLKTKTAVKSRTQAFAFDSTLTRFVRYTKDLGYENDDREYIPLEEALIGVSMSSRFVNRVDDLSVGWTWLAPGQARAPVLLNAGSERMARYLTELDPVMNWRRSDLQAQSPKLRPLPLVIRTKRSHQPIWLKVGLGILALAGIIVLILKTRTPTLVFFLIPLGVVALVGAYRFAKSVPILPEEQEATELVRSLLRNTYHAFDFRDESDIYDTLEYSIEEGPLLEAVYLEIRNGLELEIRGGPRVLISGIDLRECKIIARNDDAGTFDVQAIWGAVGDVNHWGHSHLRTNRYKANLRVKAFGDTWKITKMQVLDEERKQVTTTDRQI